MISDLPLWDLYGDYQIIIGLANLTEFAKDFEDNCFLQAVKSSSKSQDKTLNLQVYMPMSQGGLRLLRSWNNVGWLAYNVDLLLTMEP